MDFEVLKQYFLELPLEKKIDLFNSLPDNEKGAIVNSLGNNGLTVILGGNNVVANSLASPAFQFNSKPEEVTESLSALPPEVLADFLKAIASSIIEKYGNNYHQRKK